MAEVTCIYKIVNITNNKIYVGSAVNFRKRKNLHLKNLRDNKHHSKYLQSSYNKHGIENFKFCIIELCEKENLLEREQYYIDALKPQYNVCKSVEKSRLGLKSSPEHIAKIVAANTGKPKSKEHRERLRIARIGSKLTEDQKQARRDYRHSDKAKLKISIARFGFAHTDEAKAKMSIKAKTRIRKPLSEATKLKLSEAAKKQWQRQHSELGI